MPLYKWSSRALKNYASGSIIVHADSVEKAREIVRNNAQAALARKISWLEGINRADMDEDDRELHDEFMIKLGRDIEREPEIAEVFFIPGSE